MMADDPLSAFKAAASKQRGIPSTRFQHRRTAGEIHRCRRGQRTDIKPTEWDKFGYADKDEVLRREITYDAQTLPITRVKPGELTTEEFLKEFAAKSRPVIIEGACSSWPASNRWSLDALEERFRHVDFKVGKTDKGKNIQLKMKYYADYCRHQRDDSPLYLFETKIDETSAMRHLLSDFEIPDFFPDDWFALMNHDARPPHRWWCIGPKRSGTTVHTDPLGTAAWNAVTHGVKRWVLFEPCTPKRIAKGKAVLKEGEDTEAIMYFDFILPRLKEAYPDVKTYEGLQGPGDLIFVPGDWWHGVLNLEDAVAITENYCGRDNFETVWRRTRKDREKVAHLWLRNMKKFAPRLYEWALDLNNHDGFRMRHLRGPGEKKEESDADSSSESSSDSTSDEAEDLTAEGLEAVLGPGVVLGDRQLSELHRRNLSKQEEENQQRKEELRQAVAAVKRQVQEVEVSLSKLEAPDEALESQRTSLDLKCRQVMAEYGQVQEKLEINRHQQLCERLAGSADGASPPWMLTGAHETSVGRLLMSAGAASWQGNKEVQEDRFLTDVELQAPGGQRIVGVLVFDGHSGSLCVDIMMDWLPRNLQKCLSAKPMLTEEHLKQAVTEACVLTDDEFLIKAREREALDGTTMILCLVWPDEGRRGEQSKAKSRLLVANLGDSRAVLGRQQAGRLGAVRLSDDHKPGRPDEQRRIEGNGGVVDMQGVWRVFTPGPATFGGRSLLWGLAVSRAFGDLLMKEPQRYGCTGCSGALVSALPEITLHDLNANEDRFLVLACDGVWDVLDDEEAVVVCAEHKTADLAAHALVRRAFELGSDDNLTAVVVAWQASDKADPDGKKPRLD
ncbi:jmjd6-b [Symbiodinium pilosum]|uniref:Jmjd6-b protein n=1 Tax=Symbiodinium pilosum TaxID=2952 RepID=A0A812QLK2_SYMPI|nr:jmjd6-b [Symbiodinium pilosum]